MLEIIGDRVASLSWEENESQEQIIHGGSTLSILTEFKGSIVRLWDEFFSGRKSIDLSGEQS